MDEKLENNCNTDQKILLVCIYNSFQIIITTEYLKSVFSKQGKVSKILVFERDLIWKCFLEMDTVEDSTRVKKNLNNQFLLNQECKMTITYSLLQYLEIKENSLYSIGNKFVNLDYNLIEKQKGQNQNVALNFNNESEPQQQEGQRNHQKIQVDNQEVDINQELQIMKIDDWQENGQLTKEESSTFVFPSTSQKDSEMFLQEGNQISEKSFLKKNVFLELSDCSQQIIDQNNLISLDNPFVNNHQNSSLSISMQNSICLGEQQLSMEVEVSNFQRSKIEFGNSEKSINLDKVQSQILENNKFPNQEMIPQIQDQLEPLRTQSTNNVQNNRDILQFLQNSIVFKQSQIFSTISQYSQQDPNSYSGPSTSTSGQLGNSEDLQKNKLHQISFGFNQFHEKLPLFQTLSDYQRNFKEELSQNQKSLSFLPQEKINLSFAQNQGYVSRIIYVKGFYNEKININMIHSLFSNFGNIIQILYVKNKKSALIEYESHIYSLLAKEYMNNQNFFGNQLKIQFSVFQQLKIKEQNSIVQDAQTNFYSDIENQQLLLINRKNYRFKANKKILINPPSNTLHLSNIKDDFCNEESIKSLFENESVEAVKIMRFEDQNKYMALVKFHSIDQSFQAVAQIHGKTINQRQIMLSFTRSMI